MGKKKKSAEEVVAEPEVETTLVEAEPATEEVNENVESLKTVFMSTTVWGIIISVFSKLSILMFDFGLDESAASEIVNLAATYSPLLIGFVGDAVALRGRMKAKKALTFKKKKRKK